MDAERELPWPPERPPAKRDVNDAWAAAFKEMIRYLKRNLDETRSETRTLLKILKPRELSMRLMTHEAHGESTFEEIVSDVDFRPHFDAPNQDDDGLYDDEGDPIDEENGDLATNDIEYYSTDTRFCISMSLDWHEAFAPTDPDNAGIVEYDCKRISVVPETAAYLISRIADENVRKTIADALVFQMIRDDGEQLAEEELEDGDVAPIWRNRENDPALDSLRICTHLRSLYMRLVAGEHLEEHFNDDPDAPEQPPGT